MNTYCPTCIQNADGTCNVMFVPTAGCVNPAEVEYALMPGAPVGPVTPVAPAGPVGPVEPIEPVAPVTPAMPSGETNPGPTALPTGMLTPEYPRFCNANVGTEPDATKYPPPLPINTLCPACIQYALGICNTIFVPTAGCVNPAEVEYALMPGAPVGPVTPVAPAGPVGPVTPVPPAGPVGPVEPIEPVAPVTPAIPPGETNPAATALPTGMLTPEYPRFCNANVGAEPDATV